MGAMTADTSASLMLLSPSFMFLSPLGERLGEGTDRIDT